MCIARRESGLLPWAESGDGMNKGLFQQHVNYWDGNYDTFTRSSWGLSRRILSGRTNTIVSIRMAHDPDIGWGPGRPRLRLITTLPLPPADASFSGRD